MAFIDARTLPNGSEIEADLIIIGAGMAGIAMAYEWAGAGKSVAVLESGDREPNEETQALYRGSGFIRAPDNPDRNIDDYLHRSRHRGLGGSGNIWGGKCVPLDPSDFAARDWIEFSGWPLTREALQPFYDRACDRLQIARFDAPFADAARPPLHDERLYFSAPRRFSRLSGIGDAEAFDRFRTGFAEAENIRVYLNANITRLRRGRRGLSGLDVACLNGRRHTARARAYVLATGGIENARLMLASNIGNESNWLGRCFQGHVTFGVYEDAEGLNTSIAVTDANRNVTLYTNQARDTTHCVLAATLEGQRAAQAGNFTVTMIDEETPTSSAARALWALAARADHNAAAPAHNLPCFFMSEHIPNRHSRIVLDEANADALGVPRVRLEWLYSERDFASLEANIHAFAADLGAANAARVCWPVARSSLVSILNQSRHHIGTTRMSAEATFGVVDAECRVHGVDNLYVAGSSVFPTSGIANPTLTLMALAIRLADHLKQELGVRA